MRLPRLALLALVLASFSCALDDGTTGDDDMLDETESAITGSYAGHDADSQAARINPHRHNHVGRRALDRRACLDKIARHHAYKMADGQCPGGDAICHFSGLGNAITNACPFNWTAAGENVGIGSTELGLWKAFLASSEHHANIDSASYNMMGVGAFRRSSDNALFIVQIFAHD